jgi:archaellum component FlaC
MPRTAKGSPKSIKNSKEKLQTSIERAIKRIESEIENVDPSKLDPDKNPQYRRTHLSIDLKQMKLQQLREQLRELQR